MTHPAAPSHPVRRAILALTLALAATAPAPAAEVTLNRPKKSGGNPICERIFP